MAFRSAAVRSGAELIALHQRFPGDTIGGVAGTLSNGVLAQLGASGRVVTFEVPSRGPHTLTVFDGAPESGSGWESEPGITLPETTIVGDPGRGASAPPAPPPGTGTAPPRPPPAGVPARSSTPYVLLGLAAVVVAVVLLGGK